MSSYRRKYDKRLKSSTTAKVAKVQSDVSAIKRLVYNELKFNDQFGAGVTINNGGANYVVCNNLAQGDGASQRTGNGVGNKRLVIKVNGVHNPLGSATMNLRVMLIKDKQPNGALPAAATLLQNVSFQSGINDAQLARFRVMYDRIMPLSLNGPATGNIRIGKRLKDFTRYSGNAGTIADIQTNAYYLYLISDQAANGPLVAYNIRYNFSDM